MAHDPNRGRLSEQLADIADAFTEIGLRVSGRLPPQPSRRSSM